MNSPHDKLLQLISEMVPVDHDDKDIIINNFESVRYSKRSMLVAQGSIAKYMYFINFGYVRSYYFRDAEEVTNNINCPMGFITAFGSYVSQTPSYEYLECITDCNLLQIEKSKLDDLFLQNQKWSEVGRKVNENILMYNEARTRRMVSLSAEQRYQDLIVHHPDFIQNVPLQYIASYIGVKPESLSRIRKNISNHMAL